MLGSSDDAVSGFFRLCCCSPPPTGQTVGVPTQLGAGLSRRRFLKTALVGLGTVAVGGPLTKGLGLAEAAPSAGMPETLKSLILAHAQTPDNPWLLFHGVRALGRSFTVQGVPAFDYLCSHYLKERSVSGQVYLSMPVEVEGHTNAFLSEAVLDAGIPTSRSFQVNGRRYTVNDLVKGARALFRFDPASFDRDDLAWSLVVFAHTTDPKQDTWTNASGQRIRFSEVVEFGMATLEETTATLRTAMRKGVMPTEKDRIHDFTCGGTHLIYGLMSCLRFGHAQRGLRERLQAQFDLLLWRLKADPYLIDRFYQQATVRSASKALADIHLWDAKLKFLGHAMEIVHYTRLFGLLQVPPSQAPHLKDAQRELTQAVESIVGVGVGQFADNRRLYNLLLGDSCHAYHGLRMKKGENQA